MAPWRHRVVCVKWTEMQTKQAEVLEKLREAFPSTKIRSDDAFPSWGMTYPDAEAYLKSSCNSQQNYVHNWCDGATK